MSTAPAASPLRYATPAQMFFCVILFFMPWVEVQCAGESQSRPTWKTTHSQSGMQIARGWYALPDEDRASKDDGRPLAPIIRWMKKQVERGEGPEAVGAAPVLWVYLGAAVVAVVVGLVLPSNNMRMWILIVCCAAALFAVGGSAVVGFPVLEAVEKEGVKKPHKRKAVSASDLSAWAQSPAQFEKQAEEGSGVRVLYRVWFYLALVLPLGALFTALAEPLGLRATASGYVIPPQRIT
ncbi:MAG: hypothetical protein C0467_00800 [Planctomycetaceae bacterium]|nr:hypothetical protein [Planctomycetaceae bacterium]